MRMFESCILRIMDEVEHIYVGEREKMGGRMSWVLELCRRWMCRRGCVADYVTSSLHFDCLCSAFSRRMTEYLWTYDMVARCWELSFCLRASQTLGPSSVASSYHFCPCRRYASNKQIQAYPDAGFSALFSLSFVLVCWVSPSTSTPFDLAVPMSDYAIFNTIRIVRPFCTSVLRCVGREFDCSKWYTRSILRLLLNHQDEQSSDILPSWLRTQRFSKKSALGDRWDSRAWILA